jgi:YHS domain-containing protein
MARDPVCGMEVDERTAAATAEYQGTTYYFCAPGYITAPTAVTRTLAPAAYCFRTFPALSLLSFLCIKPTTCLSLNTPKTRDSPIST